jgi:Beta-glucan synthesis-associated protein SKN1/KRE6/Sbg1
MKNASLLSLLCLMTASILQCYKIDPETVPRTTIRRRDQAVLDLVMSDEFSLEGRSFAKGDDSVFEAQERPDDINQAISFCKLHFCHFL